MMIHNNPQRWNNNDPHALVTCHNPFIQDIIGEIK